MNQSTVPPIPLVDLRAQYATIAAEVEAAMQAVIRDAAYILGPAVAQFETHFAAYCETRHCVGVASGTDALHLMLRAAGIGPGDEVIVPAFTFVATALGVTLAGATPVLVDVRREDGLLDPAKVEAAITPRTRAILPVHLYGRCADMQPLGEIAARHNLLLFEDAAQAHGARYHGRRVGSLGHAAAFSFYPGKNLGAFGDGGAITTNDAQLAEKLRLLRNLGSQKKYYHDVVGFNSRLDTLQAAVLDVKLKSLDDWNARRRAHAATYARLLAGHEDLALPAESSDRESVYHLYVVRTGQRDALLKQLNDAGVGAGIHYPFPIHRLDAYRELAPKDDRLRESERWSEECLSLPMYAELTDAQLEAVASRL